MPDPETHDAAQLTAPEVSRRLFGGVLTYDAAGHYSGLELLNFVFGNDVVLPVEDNIYIRRHSHDFARRLAWDDTINKDPQYETILLSDGNAERTLRSVLRCLQLQIPNLKGDPAWHRAHFFPYTPSLIHWDARERAGRVLIERKYMRGGGALAFKVLRKDPNGGRLERIRNGFNELYAPTKESPLEQLARFLRDHSKSDQGVGSIDEVERDTALFNDEIEDQFRDGCATILEQTHVTTVVRIQSLINWTAIWLATMQYRRSLDVLGKPSSPIVFDCFGKSSQLRRASQRCLKDAMNCIVDAVVETEPRLPRAARTATRGFFWASAASVGLLNAWRGRRHFCLSVDALETIVLAHVAKNEEMPFERFVFEVLYLRLGFVVGRQAADHVGLLSSIDASIFEDNEAALAEQMSAAGLMKQYSDATRMVASKGAA
jgi:hypothetical protein